MKTKAVFVFPSHTVEFDMCAVQPIEELTKENLDRKVAAVTQFCEEASIFPCGLSIKDGRYMNVTFEMSLDAEILRQAFAALVTAGDATVVLPLKPTGAKRRS